MDGICCMKSSIIWGSRMASARLSSTETRPLLTEAARRSSFWPALRSCVTSPSVAATRQPNAALGALGKTVKPVEIAVGLAAVIFGVFGLIGGGYWYTQMDVDDDTFDDDDKGWTRSPCTAGCELELFVGATAVFTGIGVVCATARGGETRGKAESSGWGAAYVERGSGAV